MSTTATSNLELGTSNAVSHSPPPPLSPSQKLPPTERDFEIYDAIHIASSSTRRQAELHRISQTRVRQIVRRVVEWLGEVLPPQAKVAKEQETHLARQIAADRFQRQLEQITALWDATLDTKFASIRIRLTTAQARLGVVGGLIDGLAADCLEGLPVPAWHAPADPEILVTRVPPGNALPRGSSLEDATENPKSLFPPPGYTPKRRDSWKDMPQELWDPINFEAITPEIVAARAAWGHPLRPTFIKTLQDMGQLPRDESESPEVGLGSPDPALAPTPPLSPSSAPATQSEICNPQSEIPPPPPLGACSPSGETSGDLDPSATTNLAINHDSQATYTNDTPIRNDPNPPENTTSQPLLTAHRLSTAPLTTS